MGRPRKTGKKKPDQKRVRAKTSDKIHALRSEVVALQVQEKDCLSELRRFHDEDLFQFQQWIQENHSAGQKELQEILREIEIYEEALDEAECALFYGGFSNFEEALVESEKEVRKEFDGSIWQDETIVGSNEFEEPAPGAGPPREVVDSLFYSFLEEVKGIDIKKLDKETLDQYRAEFEATFEHVEQGNYAAFEKSMLRLAGDDTDENQSAAKIVFRRLVRRLHPDHHPEFGEEEKALWNEAMVCYEGFDTEGLELVEVKLQILQQEEITPSQTPVLRRYRDELKFLVEDMQEELEDAALHPGWKFSLKRKTKAFFRKLEKGFEEALTSGRARLASLTLIFTEAKSARKQKRKSPGKKRAAAAEKVKSPAKKAAKPKKKTPVRESSPMAQEEFPF